MAGFFMLHRAFHRRFFTGVNPFLFFFLILLFNQKMVFERLFPLKNLKHENLNFELSEYDRKTRPAIT